MIAKTLLLVTLLGLCASKAYGAATMTMQTGKVVDLDQLARQQQGKCCVSVFDVGLGSDRTIMRMDGSGGKYFVTNDPNCGNVIYSSSYPSTFDYIYLCGQCKGGCPQVDGGKIIVPRGGTCTKADGSVDVYLVCENSAPICHQVYNNQPGKCSTYADVQANPAPCKQFWAEGKSCDDAKGMCCSGAPKYAKCDNYECKSIAPTPAPPPTPAPGPVSCTQFAVLGSWCNDKQGKCCGGAPKNAKCENNKCVTTYPPPAPAPTPAPGPSVACTQFAVLGSWCDDKQGKCCGGAPKNAKCENYVCVTTYPTGSAGVTPLSTPAGH